MQKRGTGSWTILFLVAFVACRLVVVRGIGGATDLMCKWSYLRIRCILSQNCALEKTGSGFIVPPLQLWASAAALESDTRPCQYKRPEVISCSHTVVGVISFIFRWNDLLPLRVKRVSARVSQLGCSNLCFLGKGYFLELLKRLRVHTLTPWSCLNPKKQIQVPLLQRFANLESSENRKLSTWEVRTKQPVDTWPRRTSASRSPYWQTTGVVKSM